MADKVINMVMLGPSRVGKSSLLATMYREIGKMKTGFDLTPIDETQDRLDDAYHRLDSMLDKRVFSPVEGGLKGTEDFIEHHFEVGFESKKEFDLVFHDFRGGAMMRAGDDLDELRNLVAGSRVIFNVLDSVALMELDELKGDSLNGHDRVCTLLKQTLKPGEKYLIVFVLVKCETYVKTSSERERLINRFEERHRCVLRLIEKLNALGKNVVAILIPAITLGGVEFQEIDQDGKFVFVRTQRGFEPREVDQPLKYALAFALNHVNENRWWGDRLMRAMNGQSKAFSQALRDFYSQRNDNYKKYGNDDLLKVR
jgi:hypothetical protein